MANSGGAERFIHAKVGIIMRTIFVGLFSQGGIVSVVSSILLVFLISPTSCLWNLLGRAGWVTFDFCDISDNTQAYIWDDHLLLRLFLPFNFVSLFIHLGSVHTWCEGTMPKYGTRWVLMWTHPFFQAPTLEFGHGAGARVQGLVLVLGHKSGHRVPVCSNFC